MTNANSVFIILAAIFALGAAVLAFIFIIPEKKREGMNKIFKLLHDICNFKFLIIEKILQFCYVLATAFTVIYGFLSLFSFNRTQHYFGYGEWGYTTEWVGYYGFLIMILGPIAVRISYELLMMLILAVKNIIQINNKLKNQNDDRSDDAFALPSLKEYAPEPAPAAKFCVQCGSPLNADGTCPVCK